MIKSYGLDKFKETVLFVSSVHKNIVYQFNFQIQKYLIYDIFFN